MSSVGIRIPSEDKQQLAAIAAKDDLTISQIIRKLIKKYLQEREHTHERQ